MLAKLSLSSANLLNAKKTNLATMRAVYKLRVLHFFFGNNLSMLTRHACKCMSSYVFIPLFGAHIIMARDLNAQILSLSGIVSQVFRMCQRVRTQRENCVVCALYDLPLSPSIFYFDYYIVYTGGERKVAHLEAV